MSSNMKPIVDYTNALQKNLATGKATEPSHYPALRVLMESLGEGTTCLLQATLLIHFQPQLHILLSLEQQGAVRA